MNARLWSAAASAVALSLALTLTSGASADPATESDLDQAEQDLAEAEATLENATKEAREAGEALKEAERELPGAQDRVNTARGVTAAAKIAADTAVDEADAAREVHGQAESEFDDAQASVTQARDDLSDIARETYQGGDFIAINAVLSSTDPLDAVERIGYVNQVAFRQSEALDDVVRLRQDAREAERDANEAREDAEDAEEAAEEALETAQTEEAAAEAAEIELEDLIDTQADALDVAESERDESLDQYDEAEAESERLADLLKDAGAGDDQPSGGDKPSNDSARLLMPVAGWKSSDFGNRYDPYYDVWQMHAGTDFAAGGGAPIYAADSGTVVQAGWNGGYGNYTCLYHGDNVSTCYAHQSRIDVGHGESVQRGQQIGAVGTTGASTGDHLHFEVRVGGSPVQPLDWLPSCLC
ncbi:MAG: peptidoglycan DD-metalloendopeptidase family protein [Stackebrandtia sp.]